MTTTTNHHDVDDQTFDSRIRENYMVFLYLVACCLAATWVTLGRGFTWSKRKRIKHKDTVDTNINDLPLISTICTILSLGLSLASLLAIPISHVTLTFPHLPRYLEVDAVRISNLTWNLSTVGSLTALLFLTPFSFFYGESAGTTWRARVLSTTAEVILSLGILAMASLLLIRRNLLQDMGDFPILIKQALGVVVLLPGMFFFLFAAPAGIVVMLRSRMDALVPMSSAQHMALESKLLLLQLGMINSDEERREIRLLEAKFASSTKCSLALAVFLALATVTCSICLTGLAIIGPWNLPINSHVTFRFGFLILQLFCANAIYHGATLIRRFFVAPIPSSSLPTSIPLLSTLFLLVLGLTSPLALFSLGVISFDSVQTLSSHLSITYLMNGSNPIPVRVFDAIFAFRLGSGMLRVVRIAVGSGDDDDDRNTT